MRCLVLLSLLFVFTACNFKGAKKGQKELGGKVNYPTYQDITEDLPYKKEVIQRFKKENGYKIDSFYNAFWLGRNVSGGFLVAKNGQIIFEKYNGYADKANHKEMNADTPMHLASISKVLTSVAILKLVEAGKLRLDESVSEVLPKFPYKEITIKDLLTHRSGLQNYAYFKPNEKYWAVGKIKSNQDILNYIAKGLSEVYAKPNQKFSYCNTNFSLLALIIEKITKDSYPDAMQNIVFKPFGMNDTFVYQPKDRDIIAKTYTPKGLEWARTDLDLIYGDKNIYSTPRDLLKLDKAMYSPNFLNKNLRTLMKTGYSNEHKGMKNYGLGIRMLQWQNGNKLLYHNGWWHGNNTSYSRNEKDTITVIGLGNQLNRAVYSSLQLAKELGKFIPYYEIVK